jgi:hypothetical protein
VIAAFADLLDASNACPVSGGATRFEPFYFAWGCFRVFARATLVLPANEPRAFIPRCSEIIAAVASPPPENPPQFFLSATAAHAMRFSPLADVLTFLRLSFRQTSELRLSNRQNKITAWPAMAALGE